MTPLSTATLLVICVGLYFAWKLFAPVHRRIHPWDVYVIDGDTLSISHPDGTNERVRVSNLDAPEISGFKCLWQGHAGTKARNEVCSLLTRASSVTLKTSGVDRYGRTLARVTITTEEGSVDVGRHLIKKGLARRWHR